ncbi:carboxylic acid transporter protein [Scheffersomyces stipitis CBS 6054]|uniref:Carboxylic acid transporter protein n=1 Tax=Scheffersomyces stipitis (strain ATCC 58785 / CBS 6054 / NBRC 10063 / NRRL Y-11545) TaxID=322104 RepID=A3LQ41_PICST|nr:carboxylic acid transporter protein [Scheffersomyces stipitis CBS 6054]ABN65148.2 carboxylic acid transporter protein [Scheffersomyces stipitis CBS 6054]KAG2736964.1 hypothetical protein G9P44_001054 [Scheffersomyces stipitis]
MDAKSNDLMYLNSKPSDYQVERVDDEIEQVAREIFNEKPDLSWPTIKKYASTRLSTLFDLPIHHTDKKWYQLVNPVPALKSMSKSDYNFYFLGFFAWTVDSMDFFCVSVTAPYIAATLNVNTTQITWGLTLVLMFRSVGAFIFGLLADYYGRKWPYIIICLLFIIVEVGTGFVQTYAQFLGVRALFGILMGAMYPVASVTALENQPKRAQSVLSGLFLPGYSLGYIFAMVFFRAFQGTYREGEGWRSLFWFSAGLPLILIVWRLPFPESAVYLKIKESKKRMNGDIEKTGFSKVFDKSALMTIKTEWLMFIYLVLLLTGFNFTTHGSQDLYVTLLTKQYNVDSDYRTVIVVVSNLAGIVGGVVVGSFSEVFGRRLSIIICMIWCGAFLYPAFMHAKSQWWAYAMLNAGVMGAWGIAPIHLLELVNATHRAFLSGLVYQLGNLASSAASTIEARLGERFPLGDGIYDYGKVVCIFCGAVFAYMIFITIVGPERFHRDLEVHYLDEVPEEGSSSDMSSTNKA